jgi:hypothetical protein
LQTTIEMPSIQGMHAPSIKAGPLQAPRNQRPS